MPLLGEVHISGVTFSRVVSLLFSALPSVKHKYSLFGHYDIQKEDTDAEEAKNLLHAVVTIILPSELSAPPGTVFLGYASARRCGPHKLSFDETGFLLRHNGQLDVKHGKDDSTYPLLLLLVTVSPDTGLQSGTVKVEYSVFQGVDSARSTLSAINVIPMKVDNMIDSLSGFVRVCNLASQAPVDTSRMAVPSVLSMSETEVAFESSVTQIENAGKRKQELLQRILELRKLLSDRRILK